MYVCVIYAYMRMCVYLYTYMLRYPHICIRLLNFNFVTNVNYYKKSNKLHYNTNNLIIQRLPKRFSSYLKSNFKERNLIFVQLNF